MKIKAQHNLEAAQLLINNNSYTESVHCSYYAVLQYMKYMLNTMGNNAIPYEEQEYKGKDSHTRILEEISIRISGTPKVIRGFKEKVRLLRNERVRADYKLDSFEAVESAEIKQKAEGLITNLKTYFGNI